MKLDEFRRLKPGDRIEFKAATRSHCRKAVRPVLRVGPAPDQVAVTKYHGWQGFVVRRCEVLRVVERA